MTQKDEKPTDKLKVLCPYCSKPWTVKMEADLDYSMGSEYTGIYGEEVAIKIYCDNCKRLIYTKDNILYDPER
jgi:hypothetical protein